MLSPKIHSAHMLDITCSQDPCRNIDVKKGRKAPARDIVLSPANEASTLAGTTPNCRKVPLNSRDGTPASKTKISRLSPTRKYVMNGVVVRGASSRRGIMDYLATHATTIFDRSAKIEDNRSSSERNIS